MRFHDSEKPDELGSAAENEAASAHAVAPYPPGAVEEEIDLSAPPDGGYGWVCCAGKSSPGLVEE